jgi:hypothetical protein
LDDRLRLGEAVGGMDAQEVGDGGASWAAPGAQLPTRLLALASVTGDRHAMFALETLADSADQAVSGAAQILLHSGDGGTHWKPLALPALAGND